MLLVLADLIERRLRDVDVPVVDERLHVTVEEREEQRADVRAVHVCIGHDDDLAVATLREVKLLADARAERRDHRADLGIGKDLVEACLLHVEDLAAQREDRLEPSVASLLRRTPCRVALDDVDLALVGILDGAVCELAGETGDLERVLAARQLTCLACCLAGTRRHECLVEHLFRDGGVLLEVLRQSLGDDGVDDAAHLGVAELCLGLPLELRLAHFEADDGGQSLAHILAREVAVLVL